MKFNHMEIDEQTIDFESLARISVWPLGCWKSAWDTLVRYEYPIDDFDEVWAFLIRVVFRTPIPPTDVADMILEIFDEKLDGSQFIHRV